MKRLGAPLLLAAAFLLLGFAVFSTTPLLAQDARTTPVPTEVDPQTDENPDPTAPPVVPSGRTQQPRDASRVSGAATTPSASDDSIGAAAHCTPGPNKVLIGCVYNGQNLGGANFSASNLTGATFNGANLAGSNFSNANLTAATFDGANLSCSNFNGANLTATTLNGANLAGSTFDGATFTSVTFGTSTTCPDGTTSGANGNTCLGHLQPVGCGVATTTPVATATVDPDGTTTPVDPEGTITPTGAEPTVGTSPGTGGIRTPEGDATGTEPPTDGSDSDNADGSDGEAEDAEAEDTQETSDETDSPADADDRVQEGDDDETDSDGTDSESDDRVGDGDSDEDAGSQSDDRTDIEGTRDTDENDLSTNDEGMNADGADSALIEDNDDLTDDQGGNASSETATSDELVFDSVNALPSTGTGATSGLPGPAVGIVLLGSLLTLLVAAIGATWVLGARQRR
jgi:hypothetical protein